MSARSALKGMTALCAVAFLLSASSAHTQEAEAPSASQPPVLTIADCPPGYELAVQDVAQQQPTDNGQNDSSAMKATNGSLQPAKQFVTGCVPIPQGQ